MTDLELLDLVGKAQEKQRGPQGEPGVGIDSVEQYDEQSFTLKLTNGAFKRIQLPKAADGATGPAGERGESGPVGPAGRDGRGGKDGLQGAPGLPGADGTTVETAIVSSAGNLLLGLSDGTIIDAGRVVGPAGATGSAGPAGLPGERGSDGAAVLSGPRAPQESDGAEGDHWIDISSAEFGFYKKSGSGWDKLANLRQPAPDRLVGAGAGSGGGAGGGKGELQTTRTLPLINGGTTFRKQTQARGLPPVPGEMKTQEDANLYFLECIQNEDVIVSDSVPRPPYQVGQLWFSTNPEELTLYVFDGAVWVPAAPPVSLDGIESSITGIVERLDEGEVKQDALTERVSDGEVKQRQIELSLEELSVTKGSVARYTVTETHIGAANRNGELYVSSPNAADVKAISFAPFDINGQPTRPANTGDIIEFVEVVRDVGQVTRYRIVDGGNSQALVVDYISGDNNFAKGENQEVYIYPQNEEGVSKDYVDGLDELNVKKAGSTMTGDLCFDGGSHSIRMLSGTKLRFTGSDPGGNQRTFIDIKNELSSGVQGDEDGYRMRLYHLSDPDNPYQAANKKYVDESIAAIPSVDLDGYATEQYVDDAISNINVTGDYLPLSGGELTGSFSINKGDKPHAQWKITPNGGDNYATNIYNLGNGEMRFRTSHTDAEAGHKGSHIVLSPNGGNPQTKIYNVVPAGDTTAVPKSYVDNAVASVSAPPTGPASLAWEWRNHDTLSDPGEGKVAWYSASQFYRLNLKSANGVDLGKNRIAPKDHSFSTKPYGSVWAYVNGGWQLIKMFDIGRIQWNKNDCIWIYSSTTHFGSNNFTAGQKYYFTVGGFF